MGATNFGTQTITVQYYDPVDANVVNRAFLNIRERGIYIGGYLTRVSDVAITLSPLTCEIGDAGNQVRIQTANDVPLTVGVGIPWIILRWAYATSATNYMDVLAVAIGDILATDLIVGKCAFTGSVLSTFEYGDLTYPRSTPRTLAIYLKPEPTVPDSMRIRIRAGRTNYGTANLEIPDQLSPLFTAPLSGSRVDVVYVDTDGTIKVKTGVASGGTPTVPTYDGRMAIAEITLTNTTTSLTYANIKDVRSFVGGGAGGLPAFTGNAYKYVRVKSDETGVEYVYPKYAP